MPEKRYLMTPGPTPVPPEVLAAIAEPVVHHRGPDFRVVLERCLARLENVFRTETDVLMFTASGTGAMESAVANLVGPGERVTVVSNGYFGERWQAIAASYDAEVDVLEYEWGEVPSADDLASRLAERPAKVVLLTHSETSTGVVADVRSLAAAAKDAGALVVVDAVSSLGAVPLETDAWGIDVVCSGSQKALMTPPGLAFASVSDAAYAARTLLTALLLRLGAHAERAARSSTQPSRRPSRSSCGLDVALWLLLEEGLESAFERHVRLGRACRAGAKAMGLELFSPDDDRSAVVTAIRAPDGIDSGDVVLALRDKLGITIANGQGPLKGQVFRIGHIGYFDVFDITTALAAVELALAELGADVERGVAVAPGRSRRTRALAV